MTRFGAAIAEEMREAPAVVRRQAAVLETPLAALLARLRDAPPQLVVTCARGSSAHAATFAKHLIERHRGVAVAAAAPNIASIYRRPLQLRGQFFLTISQSGMSEDMVEATAMARRAGAVTAALVNDTESPLAKACDIVLPMAAGPERSIAATKTFVASLAALLRLTAAWSDDAAMRAACERLPDRLAAAAALDWSEALDPLAQAASLVAIGRGPTLAIAREAALKLKESCALHAEAFSSAEFRHGPVALVEDDYPLLVFTPADESRRSVLELVADLRRKGARVLVAESEGQGGDRLPALPPDQPDADAVCLIQSFYAFLLRLADQRGSNIDKPRHLQKVTRTR